MSIRAIHGDCRVVLKTLPDESVHCVVTSPPYFGLRDYGIAGQIGLEATPDAYVAELAAVFREVKRVLRSDGVCFLNLGDSYGAGKQLQGIPWKVAFALQSPYYTGRIKSEIDRVWLAAMIDAEGCMFIHKRKIGQNNGQGYERKSDTYGVGLEIANCSKEITDRCLAITGIGSVFRHEKDRRQPLFRWQLRSNECRDIVREVYPCLVAKKHQARLLLSCPSSGPKADAAHTSLIALHNGLAATIDFPAPVSMYEPGWILRQDLIWSKLNPMPESVRDRCTKAHEYIFLLSKSPRYFWDAEAIKEENSEQYRLPAIKNRNVQAKTAGERHDELSIHAKDTNAACYNGLGRNKRSVWEVATQPFSEAHFATFPPALIEPCIKAGCPAKACATCGKPWLRETSRGVEEWKADPSSLDRYGNGSAGVHRKTGQAYQNWMNENPKRTLGFSPSCSCAAATVPGTVLDPFGGAGTTGLVADRLGRDAILIELNEDYSGMSRRRIHDDAPLFAEVLA